MAVLRKTDRVILRCLFIASIIVTFSVFIIHLKLLESEENLNHHNPYTSLLSYSQQDDFPKAPDQNKLNGEYKYHLVFSTDCSIYQDWQSYVFFYHVLQSGQEGQVTRIASGCGVTQKKDLNRIFESEIASMAPGRFHLHHTPDYSKIKAGVSYRYFNKPFGMKHWMDNVLGYPQEKDHDDDIIILLDPDQIIKRPFSAEFQLTSEDWHKQPDHLRVDHGSPFAQLYGYSWKRKEIKFSDIFPNSSTPITNLTKDEVYGYHHGMGPPYLATAKDMYRIVKVWRDVVPRVHDQFPELLAEMFGYNIAAAHLGLRHTLAKSFMLSSPTAYKIEAWEKLVDPLPPNRVCAKDLPQESYPHVIHYCQKYGIGKWFFGKLKFRRTTLLSCGAPLMKEPPQNVMDLYTSAAYPTGRGDANVIPLSMPRRRHDTFMLCNIIRDVNRAIVHYKQHHCKKKANYEYGLTFFANMKWEG